MQVDPHMVTKKKNDRDVEVQEGWEGHILPFELVQEMYLTEELHQLQELQRELAAVSASYSVMLDSLTDEEKEAGILNDAGTEFVGKEVRAKVDEALEDIHCFSAESQNAEFMSIELNGAGIESQLCKIISSGARMDGLLNISFDEYTSVSVLLPKIEEQDLIADYFRSIDNLITLHQSNYEKMVATKKSMLDKLFPQGNAKVPAIRFEGFVDEWEKKPLGELFEEYSEKEHEEFPPLTIIQGAGTILRNESDRKLMYNEANLSGYKLVRRGDFIVHLRSFEGGLEIATTTGIISPAYHTFHGENVNSDFYYAYFRSRKFIDVDLRRHVYGIRDGRSIDINGMKTILIPYTSQEEQKQIAGYLNSLDDLIELYRTRVEKLKNIKAACLQGMFV